VPAAGARTAPGTTALSPRSTGIVECVPPAWGALVAEDPSASPSHRPEVWAALAAVFPGFAWRLLAHEEGGELVGGAPVVLARRGPFRWLHALPWLLPAVPLARAGLHRRVDLATCDRLAALARGERVVGGEWSCYRPEGDAPDPAALARVPGETRVVEAALLRLGAGLEPLRAAMSRKQRQALDHARGLGLAFAADAGALDEAYALHVAQSRGWPAHRPLPIELSRRLLAADSDLGPVARLYTLRSAAGLLSATLALESPRETFVWWSGTHPDARHHGPGRPEHRHGVSARRRHRALGFVSALIHRLVHDRPRAYRM